MVSFIAKHSLSATLTICLLLFFTAGIFFNASPIGAEEAQFLLIAAILSGCGRDFLHKTGIALLGGCFLAAYLISGWASLLLIAELFMLMAVICFNAKQEYAWPLSIIAAAFLLHLFYIQKTDIDVRQHDLNGILLYMREITRNGINWQNFDPWSMYYLFHQPLHFVIAGYLYAAALALFGSSLIAGESLQYLSLFYVTAATIFTAGIFKELGIHGKPLSAALLLAAFNPTFILFSGYISDDTPVIFWGTMSTFFIIRWYKYEKFKDIALAAIGFGLGTLTKLSMLMAVPALSALFIFQFWRASGNRKNICIGLSLFVIIAVPLALLWILRNHLLFDMQFYNIPDTSPWGQNFKYQGFIERISDFSMLSRPFINAPLTVDSNMFLALIKTELFGEWDFSRLFPLIYYPGFLLYGINIFLKICALGGVVLIILQTGRHYKNMNALLLFFAIQFLTIWAYSFKYSLDYPYACSSDYRLFAQLIIPETVILATFARKEAAQKIFLAASILYAALAATIYVMAV